MDTRLIWTLFLVPAEFLLITMHHNSDKMDSDVADFRLLRTTFLIPTLLRTLDTMD